MSDENNQPLECRIAVAGDISPTSTNEILFLPLGIHAITPVSGGIGRPINVKVDANAAVAISQQYAALVAKGKRPYFDFNHEDGPASFWPESFIWRNGEGVIASGEWSRRGKSAVEGKDFRAFSPVFHVDNKRAETATVVCKENAEPNMGGLVNNPAFKDLPLWAKNAESLGNAGDGDNAAKEKTKMENAELDALRSKQTELQAEVDALKAQNKDANQSETALENIQLKIEAAELRSRSALLSDQIQAKNKVEADTIITEAIKCGAILPKDRTNQDRWRTNLVADPATFMPLMKDAIRAAQAHNQLSMRITGNSGIQVTGEEPSRIFGAIGKLLSAGGKLRVGKEKMAISREIHAIYSRELSPVTAKDPIRAMSFPVEEWQGALVAGDVTDTDWGTLAGTLVVQRTLELLKFVFPPLTAFTTDFSSESSLLNQVIMTRTVSIPSVVSYNTSTGWADSTPDTNDVPVTITAHRGVQIGVNENVQAETTRRLFDEIAPAQAYALGKDFMDALYANITDANFTNNTVSTLANFDRADVVDIATQLNLQGVPIGPNMRTLLLYSTYFGALQKDSTIISLAAFQRPEIITGQQQNGAELAINVSSFRVFDAPNLPTNNGNVVGFAGSKSALVMAARVPNDYSTVFPGASGGGVVQLVTNPDIGLTVMLVQYIDHKLGKSSQRIALMYGTAAGQGAAGRLLKAASGSGSSQS